MFMNFMFVKMTVTCYCFTLVRSVIFVVVVVVHWNVCRVWLQKPVQTAEDYENQDMKLKQI